ncbi:MAG: hypothetical protein C4532_12785 [Candidatus Abyssobacteria bacterium SURF_17]|uniref:Uncharacterized protein n=1 Tax=Candidatus Abyssobacteria bacterium SURF_17 TaxID=2093361 RepID=A0A419EVN5_9BACT|nr:MAG: hypothetical protein C4532_12785 [Candidatus Abyssubacteria bacterium SURF_17]
MISKGDLVRMQLRIGGEGGTDSVKELSIIGQVINYSEDEGTYIVEPRAISIPKEQVAGVETLPRDFDFGDVSMELRVSAKEREKDKPGEISEIRFSRSR